MGLRRGRIETDAARRMARLGVPRHALDRRALVLLVITAPPVMLAIWIPYLALELPERHLVRDWTFVWVGFDVLLLAVLTATAVLAWRGRQLVALTASAASVLLVCDAWFDISTAVGTRDLSTAIAFAVLLELPLAALLLWIGMRVIRQATRNEHGDQSMALLSAPISRPPHDPPDA